MVLAATRGKQTALFDIVAPLAAPWGTPNRGQKPAHPALLALSQGIQDIRQGTVCSDSCSHTIRSLFVLVGINHLAAEQSVEPAKQLLS
jgi:hypothetical protein